MKVKLCIIVLATSSGLCWGDTRFEDFDSNPSWDGQNNFNVTTAMRSVLQDFDYSATTHCNATPGEIGGTICPDGTPAYVAKPISSLTLDGSFTASGTVYVGAGDGHTLVGFFNAGTINEWRTPNSLAIRIYGRGAVFQVYFEYGTSLWRAGGGSMTPLEFASNAAYPWELTYTPIGGSSGQIDVTFNGFTASMTLDSGHRGDGATMNRFGLLNRAGHADTAGTLWIDDVVINGDAEDFSVDPGWEEFQNHASYLSVDTRPRFAFGYSATQNAGGIAPGEIGGRLFRGDCRFPDRMAYYGDVITELSLETALEASGKVSLHRGVSDSTTLFGFFNSEVSVFVNPSQSYGLPKEFLGWAIEGPSAEGFYMYPCYRTQVDGADRNYASNLQYIYPDAETKDWSFNYDPEGNGGNGEISLTVDGQTSILPLQPGHKAMGATFDRFGFVTTWIDGNGQLVYVDDLTYTWVGDNAPGPGIAALGFLMIVMSGCAEYYLRQR